MTQLEKIRSVLGSDLPDSLKLELVGRLANGDNTVTVTPTYIPYPVYPSQPYYPQYPYWQVTWCDGSATYTNGLGQTGQIQTIGYIDAQNQ